MVSALPETAIAAATTEAFVRIFANAKALSAKDVHNALVVCDFLQNLFKSARASIESGLRQGGDARAIASQLEQSITDLDPMRKLVQQALEMVKTSQLPELGGDLIARYEDLDSDLANLRQFLTQALAAAAKPSPPIDWQRVKEAQDAYARGEMKPFRKIVAQRNGN